MAPSSSVPTVDTMIASFPETLEPIIGIPTYDSLSRLKAQLKINAATIPTLRGGGTHGYLAIVVSDAIYAQISQVAFVLPTNPGAHPAIPQAPPPTASTQNEMVRIHAERLREFREYSTLQLALRRTLVAAIDGIYLRSLRDPHIGYGNQTVRTILAFLFTAYGQITATDLAHNATKLHQVWNPSTPFETLIDLLDECQEYADAGSQPFTDAQLLTAAYTQVFSTGLFFDDCRTWDDKPLADRTYANFKLHILDAQRRLRLRQRITAPSGLHGANATFHGLEQAAEALANLATATASDRQSLAALTATVATQTAEIQRLQTELAAQSSASRRNRSNTNNNNNNNHNHSNNNNNRGTTNRGTNNRGNRGTNSRGQTSDSTGTNSGTTLLDEGSYCWTHGQTRGTHHTSATCRYPNPGHCTEATRANPMGGCTRLLQS
jgi:hypothetical protein